MKNDRKKLTKEIFIERAVSVHGDKYNYEKVVYINVDHKVEIICKKHGSFFQSPFNHTNAKNGCSKCFHESKHDLYTKGVEKFIEEARAVHGSKFDYSNASYKNEKTTLEIKCAIHGSFLQRPDVHLKGFGCPNCSGLSKLNTDIFIHRASTTHNNRYDYSLTEYTNSRGKVKIICNDNDHGVFEQNANSHLSGHGCPKCVYHGQSETGKILKKLLPNIEIQSSFYFIYKSKKFLADFYFVIKNQKYIVEYNGEQHYRSVCFYGMSKAQADINFVKQQKRDLLLQQYCKRNNIILITIDSRIIRFNKIEYFLKSLLPICDSPTQIFEQSYGFESIAIAQKKNICNSRLEVDIRAEIIKNIFVKIPLLASNMSTVIDADFYIKLFNAGALGILHRADTQENILNNIIKVAKQCDVVAASIGIEENQFDFSKEMIRSGCNVITIDVAHGYSDAVLNLAKKIKLFSPNTKIIIGNTTNTQLLYESYEFVDAIKVGIAQGLACETKNTAGCTEKQFSAVLKFKQISKDFGIPIISDGGAREAADFTKAIAAGANSVMAGSIFAACPESAAPIVSIDGKEKKLYAGMASRYVQDKWKGGLKPGTCPEGGVRYLDIGEPLLNLLERYAGALKSGITYAGAKDINSFQNNVEFILLK